MKLMKKAAAVLATAALATGVFAGAASPADAAPGGTPGKPDGAIALRLDTGWG